MKKQEAANPFGLVIQELAVRLRQHSPRFNYASS